MFKEASKFVTDLCGQGKTILFVGTKRQAQDADRRRGDPRGHALHQPALAGRTADQLGHGAEVGEAPSGTG